MRRALEDDQFGILDELRRQQGRSCNRDYLVVITVKDQRRYGDFLQVLGKIRLGKCLDAEVAGWQAGHHSLEPE